MLVVIASLTVRSSLTLFVLFILISSYFCYINIFYFYFTIPLKRLALVNRFVGKLRLFTTRSIRIADLSVSGYLGTGTLSLTLSYPPPQ